MHDLLSGGGEVDHDKAVEIGRWFEKTFRVKTPKTPKGTKPLKELAQKFEHVLVVATAWRKKPGQARIEIETLWRQLEPHLAELNKFYTDEEGLVVPAEVTVGSNHYSNPAGLDEKNLTPLIRRIEAIFSMLTGWRKRAISGGVKVIIAGPKDMPGSRVLALYSPSGDHIKIRATPQVLSSGFEETLIHELGHRYEHTQHPPRLKDPQWFTTDYSRTGRDEIFAELFMLSELSPSGPYRDTVQKFEELMS